MPFYRIRVCNKNVKRDGKYIEEVSNLRGCLMPPSWERTIPFLWTTEWRNCGWMWVGNHLRGEWCTDRVKYWLSVGAQPSQTVAVLLGRVCCDLTAVICRQAFFLLLPFVPLFRVLSPRRLRKKKERLLRRKSRFLLCTVCERKGDWRGACLLQVCWVCFCFCKAWEWCSGHLHGLKEITLVLAWMFVVCDRRRWRIA